MTVVVGPIDGVPVGVDLSKGRVRLASLPSEALRVPFFDGAATQHLRSGATTVDVALPDWLSSLPTPLLRPVRWAWPTLPRLALPTWQTAVDGIDGIDGTDGSGGVAGAGAGAGAAGGSGQLMRVDYTALGHDPVGVTAAVLEHFDRREPDPDIVHEIGNDDAHLLGDGGGHLVRYSSGAHAADVARSDATVRDEPVALGAARLEPADTPVPANPAVGQKSAP